MRLRRTVTIRDGRVGAEGRRGEDFAVVGRDGSIALPPDVLEAVPPGSLLRVHLEEDGSVRLIPDDGATRGWSREQAAGGRASTRSDGSTWWPAGWPSQFDGRTVLDGAGLGVRSGQVLAVTGPSGAGKTTLLWALAGLRAADTGDGRRWTASRCSTGTARSSSASSWCRRATRWPPC